MRLVRTEPYLHAEYLGLRDNIVAWGEKTMFWAGAESEQLLSMLSFISYLL